MRALSCAHVGSRRALNSWWPIALALALIGTVDTTATFSTIAASKIGFWGAANHSDKIYFAPRSSAAAGIVDTLQGAMTTADISSVGTSSSKFIGAAAANDKIYFAPFVRAASCRHSRQ